jgi:hypothetical protein
MVVLDRENFQLRWLKEGKSELFKEGKRELNENYWSVRIKELSDDLNVVGFDATALFKFKRVSHFNMEFEWTQGSKPESFSFFPQEKAADFDLKVTCWSFECPSYIKQNEYSLYTDVGN